MNERVFHNISYGVYVISTMDQERPTGCIANSAMQITAAPATIAVSINHDNYTNGCIEKSGMFALSILAESSDAGLIGTFGFQSGREKDKFEGVPYKTIEGMPVIDDCCGYIVCKVINKMETETHTVFLGEITEGDMRPGKPMTYAYYHSVVKGRSPKNAPTYLPEASEKEKEESQWVCAVCGYVYEGEVPFEELPDTYLCPICKQPKSVFVKKE